MQLNTIYIPCTKNTNAKHITLIHGWGAESTVWQSWATKYFAEFYNITLIDLPGFGDSPKITKSKDLEADWLQALARVLPNKTHLLGWSLGGLLAQQLSLVYPTKITSLVCLASTPRFTQNDGWSRSVSPQIIGDFIKAIRIEINSVLKKFWRLQLQGADNSRTLMKELINHMSKRKTPKLIPLNQGLILLKDMDNREQIAQISQPTLWLLGEKDPLIPQDIRLNLAKLQPQAEIAIIEGSGHIPFFSHPEKTAKILLDFWNKQT
jgi:pimeloyl-[acyl-carrier protein] methyl ester esterase